MAQPKKKTSKSRRDSRSATWNRKVSKYVLIAMSIGKSILKDTSGKAKLIIPEE